MASKMSTIFILRDKEKIFVCVDGCDYEIMRSKAVIDFIKLFHANF